MNDLGDWLERHALGALAPVFAEADITLDVLAELADEDLRELGISLGNRKRFQRALRDDPPGLAPETAPEAAAERRHMSVMFVDMVGSTGISRRIDPERMAELLRTYQGVVAAEIARFGGYLAKFMGDGVIAYFGWPTAREDDVQQAIRAGLAIAEAVGRIPIEGGETPACRVGIATGLVVVGDLIGSEEARERTVTGETPNLAARLEGAADPGTVLISGPTARLVEGQFKLRSKSGAELKGFDTDEEAWQVVGEVDHESRYAARARGVVRPILGRDAEIARVLDQWKKARAGRGTAVLVVAEAGVGKSRMLRAVQERVAPDDPLLMLLQCSPSYTDIALWPVIQYLRRLIDPERMEAAGSMAARVDYLTECFGGGDTETTALFAELIGVEAGQESVIAGLSAQQVRQRTLDRLVDRWLDAAATQPVFFEIEDIHWADPSTLQLVATMLEAAPRAHCLIMLTSRPENEPELDLPENGIRIELPRLDPKASREVARGLLRSVGGDEAPLPEDLLEEILARTDGIPLFIEELTKSLIENRALAEAGSDAEPTVPLTLQEMLMARLDYMNNVKAVAQQAACIGREFDAGLLVSISDRSVAEVRAALDRLVDAELLFRRDDGEDAFVFNHALIRDAAYDSLLLSTRRMIHAAIARELDKADPRQPDLIARHAERAGEIALAIANYMEAGAEAHRRSANVEAVSAYGHALRCILTLPEGPDRDRQEIDCRLAQGVPLIASRGYAAEVVQESYLRARALCEKTGEEDRLFDALRGLWTNRYNQGDFEGALSLTTTLIELAERLGSGLKQAIALRTHGSTNLSMDRFAEARAAYEACIRVGETSDLSRSVALYGEDPGVTARIMLAQVVSYSGHLDEGWHIVGEGEEMARGNGDAISIVQAAAVSSIIALLRRDYERCLEAAEVEERLSREHGFVHWHAHSFVMQGVSNAYLGRGRGNIEIAARGIADWQSTGARLYLPTFCSYLADCALACGRMEVARRAVADGLAHAEANHEQLVLSELQRLEGRIAAERGAPEVALSRLDTSLATSSRQGAWLFHMRAWIDRMRILASLGRAEEGRAGLEAALERITEHRDGPDWQAGRALLA